MIIKQFELGGDRNFGYLIADEKSGKAVVVDPSYIPGEIIKFAEEGNYSIEYFFSTHGHSDHVDGNAEVERITGKKVMLFGDVEPSTGVKIEDNAVLPLGELDIKIIYTPGHIEDHICLLVEDALVTGDTLFVGKVGGTWSDADSDTEYESLHKKLMTLPPETRVLPGHDYGVAPTSTIGHEKATNPFLIQPDLKSFKYLKANWAAYKKEHNIQ